jgi:hypothetical protein
MAGIFQVGDSVRYIGKNDPRGLTGHVVEINGGVMGDSSLVNFPGWTGGHKGEGGCGALAKSGPLRNNSGWWCGDGNLELISRTTSTCSTWASIQYKEFEPMGKR